jgi:hypothetical protein
MLKKYEFLGIKSALGAPDYLRDSSKGAVAEHFIMPFSFMN